jgi:hypothetical protein
VNPAQRRRLRRRNGRAAAVNVTVPLSTLLGVDQRPGELEGYGPITAQAARRIAGHGTWRRLLTDPASGVLLDYGTTRYTPPVTCSSTCIPGTAPAGPRRAAVQRGCASSTTPLLPAAPAGAPATATAGRSARAATTERPTPGGGCPNPHPAASCGPRPPATPMRWIRRSSDPSPSHQPAPTHPSTTSNQNGPPTPTHHPSDQRPQRQPH